MSPELGATAPQTGAGHVCLDATPLIAFNNSDKVELLGQWLGVAYSPLAVIEKEIKKHPRQSKPTLEAPWLMWVPSHPDDTQLVADLLKRFGKAYPENLGEAETIVASKRYGWTAVLDDEEGRLAAKDHGVPSVYTVTLLAVAVAYDMLTPTQAWKMHVQIEKNRGNFSALKPDKDNAPVFHKFCQTLRRLLIKAGKPEWPRFLSVPGLDDLLLQFIHEARYR